jgi:hypothetical protein
VLRRRRDWGAAKRVGRANSRRPLSQKVGPALRRYDIRDGVAEPFANSGAFASRPRSVKCRLDLA